jgi:two-component system, cell cycle response regulator DivK
MSNKKHILVAEDSSVIQNITKSVLQLQNFEIDFAKNGQEVLDKLKKKDYSAILLDINMPVMDGIECARKIRELPDKNKANIPIVAISGNARNYTMDDFKAVGINEYLPKPLNFDNLVVTVKKITAS